MSEPARKKSFCSVRTSTHITAKARGGRTVSLAELIRCLAGIDGLERLRYMTSHPRDMSDDLIAAHAEVPQLMPFLHLPVQSGSDRVLTAMNRKHTVAEYIDVIARVRAARPDIALSSDFIVGFPGETDQDAEDDDRTDREDRLRAGLLVQIQPAPWNSGRNP